MMIRVSLLAACVALLGTASAFVPQVSRRIASPAFIVLHHERKPSSDVSDSRNLSDKKSTTQRLQEEFENNSPSKMESEAESELQNMKPKEEEKKDEEFHYPSAERIFDPTAIWTPHSGKF